MTNEKIRLPRHPLPCPETSEVGRMAEEALYNEISVLLRRDSEASKGVRLRTPRKILHPIPLTAAEKLARRAEEEVLRNAAHRKTRSRQPVQSFRGCFQVGGLVHSQHFDEQVLDRQKCGLYRGPRSRFSFSGTLFALAVAVVFCAAVAGLSWVIAGEIV